ncbi:MAG: hypothetical protein KBD78_04050 [Oligoflexales bacterium]|nr:hypothetical protein [Oligoflexales bacterium]
MSKLPSFQFYPGDWMRNPNLLRCSLSAQGAAIKMLCLMFDGERRGYLGDDDNAWTDEEVAIAIGGPYEIALAAVQEVMTKGVFQRRKSGCICSRRLIELENIRINRSIAGKNGMEKRWSPDKKQDEVLKNNKSITKRLQIDNKSITNALQNDNPSSSSSYSKLKTYTSCMSEKTPTASGDRIVLSQEEKKEKSAKKTNRRLERFCELFKAKFSRPYLITNFAESGALAKRTESMMDDSEFDRAVEEYFKCNDQRIVENGHPFSWFCKDMHRWRSKVLGLRPKVGVEAWLEQQRLLEKGVAGV